MKRIKILYLIGSMDDGGAQRVILNHLKKLNNDNEIELKVLVYSDKSNSYCNKIIEQNNYNVDYVFKNLHNKYIRKIIKLILGKYLLKRNIKKYNPDIVNVHITAFLTICLKPIINARVPIRFDTLHSNPYRNVGKNLKNIKKAFQQDNFIGICLTNEQSRQARDYYGIKRYEIVHNGIDLKKIKDDIISKQDARKKFGLKNDAFVIGTVGRLDPIKRYDLLLEIFKTIVEKNNKAFLIIAGDGKERQNLLALSRKLNIENKVKFCGNIENTTELYCALDVFVLTSKTEASPLVLIESQACGNRCVISNGTPMENICTDRVKQMQKNASINDWRDAILDCNYTGKHASNIDEFDINKMISKMKKIYLKYWSDFNNDNK